MAHRRLAQNAGLRPSFGLSPPVASRATHSGDRGSGITTMAGAAGTDSDGHADEQLHLYFCEQGGELRKLQVGMADWVKILHPLPTACK